MKSPSRLSLIALLLFVAVAALSGAYWWRMSINNDQMRASTIEVASKRASQLADLQAQHIEALILGIDQSLRQFRDALQSGNQVGAELIAQNVLQAFPSGAIVHLARIDVKGYFEYSSTKLTQPIYVGDRDYFDFHQKQNGKDLLFINKPIFSRSTHKWVILITRPIFKNNRFDGAAFISLSPEYFSNMLAKLEMSPNDIATLLHTNGTYMARSQGLNDALGKSVRSARPFLGPTSENRGLFQDEATLDKITRIFAWEKLQGYPLLVTIGLDKKTLLEPVEQTISDTRTRSAIGISLLLALTAGFSLLLLQAARQQKLLLESEAKYRDVVETTDELITSVDMGGQLTFINQMSSRYYGLPPKECIGLSAFNFIHPDDRQRTLDAFNSWRTTDIPSFNIENRQISVSGEVSHMQWSVISNRNQQGEICGFSGFARDITQQRHVEEALQESKEKLSKLFTSMTNGFALHEVIRDASGKVIDYLFLDVNPAYEAATGLSRSMLIGKSVKDVMPNTEDYWIENFGEVATTGVSKNIENFSGVLGRWYSVYAYRYAPEQFAVMVQDVSDKKKHESELEHIAYYDVLTGLPNRRLLSDRLHQAIARTRRSGDSMAVCYLDLDDFKPINDRYGHEVGDQVLVSMADNLKATLRTEDTLSRFGGDEFILLLTDLAHPDEIQVVLERVLSAVNAPIQVSGTTVSLSASIGVAIFGAGDVDPDTMLRQADQAMYQAKRDGKNRYRLFDRAHDKKVQESLHYLLRLGEALENQEFVLHYQPKVNMLNGTVIGAEALIRWQHPEQGLLTPGTFLHYLDGSELEVAVGEWVIDSALQQIAAWDADGLDLNLSVNISAHHLLRDDFADSLQLALDRHPNVLPSRLELEILETAALSDMEQAVLTLTRCRELGVRISIDDFGTGYSSLTYLRNLPVDILKVDQSFVRNMLNDPADLGIVVSVVQLAKTFNRMVIAEGVETLAHGSKLVHIGCPLMQGYGIARPMPVEHMADWIGQWHDKAVWRSLEET